MCLTYKKDHQNKVLQNHSSVLPAYWSKNVGDHSLFCADQFFETTYIYLE